MASVVWICVRFGSVLFSSVWPALLPYTKRYLKDTKHKSWQLRKSARNTNRVKSTATEFSYAKVLISLPFKDLKSMGEKLL